MSDDVKRAESLDVLHNNNVDNSVNPPTMVRGFMAKNTTSGWEYLSAINNYLMVSGSFSTTSSPLSASSSTISAVQGDAGLLRVSALGVSVTTTPLSADSSSISAKQGDAGLLHVSAIGTVVVSATNQISATLLGQPNIGAVQVTSPWQIQGTVSAGLSESNAFIGDVSSRSPDAGLFRISSIQTNALSSVGAASFGVSAAQIDAGVLHASAFVDSGSISSKSGDAGQLHTSAYLGVDTTGTLTVFQTLSVSASQSVKGSAGTLYGYYLYNTDKVPNYIKFYNVSGASNIGTDTIFMEVCLPASAAANVEFPHGIKGFTNGINITATSGRPADNTALPAASSVGAVLFYN